MTLPPDNAPTRADRYSATPADGGPRPITPTDISQFIRLDQCQRYLRLRLHQNLAGEGFLRRYDVQPQAIPPLLTRSGTAFEETVTDAIEARFRVVRCGEPRGAREPDNDRLLALARELPPGQIVVLTQPRLVVELGDWRLRGDADVVRLERDDDGELRVLIVDVKSSAAAKIEHRLQVAFYDRMVAALLDEAAEPYAAIETGILYRGAAADSTDAPPELAARIARERRLADDLLGVPDGLLELVPTPDAYRRSVADLVTNPDSAATRVAAMPFDFVPYHLNFKCDGCLYNEFCMKWSAERDDLSLLPFVTQQEKTALHQAGLETIRELSRLKQPRVDEQTGAPDQTDLVAVPETRDLVNDLGASWPVGPRLDELIHRARSYRHAQGDPVTGLSFIPSRGYGSLPFVGPDHNPNLIRIYIDAQHDYLHDRLYLVGSLIVAAERGETSPRRRRIIVELAEGPPERLDQERDLLVRWIEQTLRAVVELAAPDEEGRTRAPIHLIFYDRYDQRVLLDALGRHAQSVLSATPLYDFMTQMAAYDSPIATFLSDEIRELKNYPMVSQSLQSVAKWLRFDWRKGANYWQIFRERLFDYTGVLERPDAVSEQPAWYIKRARFSSQVPLEYAYAAWDRLDPPTSGERDLYAPYRGSTPDLLIGFQRRRLEAMEWIAKDFRGNKDSAKGSFELPDLAAFEDKARGLADALDEFLTIERHVSLSQWKQIRLQAPERRVLSGDTLVVRYLESDQAPEAAAQNRENERLRRLREAYRAAWREAHPDAKRVLLPKEQREESEWSQAGLRLWLRIETGGVDASLDQILALTKLREGQSVWLNRRWSVDSRLPVTEQVPLQTTSRQMLYFSQQVRIVQSRADRNEVAGTATGWVEVELMKGRDAAGLKGFVFPSRAEPLTDDELYTLDEDPSDWTGSHERGVILALKSGGDNILFDRLRGAPDLPEHAAWPVAAATGQRRFLAGLDALRQAGALHPFASQVQEYIAEHGETPVLLVQGPPGTGKSYTTAFALFARLQGALAAGIDYRIVISCNTHSATDVLLTNIAEVQALLRRIQTEHPAIFTQFFDSWLVHLPLFRIRPQADTDLASGVTPLHDQYSRPKGQPSIPEAMTAVRWCVAAGTPSAVRAAIVDKWGAKDLFGHFFADCLVLDEASRLSLPEAIMAALPLKLDGHLIVVGDHRQMPPIIQHDWANERRRTFQDYQTYESLFDTLRDRGLPGRPVYRMIQFAESFRLHADMAEFLRQEIYAQDGIGFHSRRRQVLPEWSHDSAFVEAVLRPDHPLVVVVHNERRSQQRNAFEAGLIAPILRTLDRQGFDPETGLGVVVPHRAQRAALQQVMADLSETDGGDRTSAVAAVDTVERYQGGERQVMIVSATESDPAYVLMQSGFLLDPRRLTVALSRAKQKMILVAARSIFELFSPDEAVFANAQLWKNLLHTTCTAVLWQGEIDGVPVEVRGNDPAARATSPLLGSISANPPAAVFTP